MKRFVSILLALSLLTACGAGGEAAAPEKENGPSSVQSETEEPEHPPRDAELYRYDTIPDFSIPNISPQKITYESVLLGETTAIVDAERIGQVMELIGKVEISDQPFREEPDAELHHVIGFYQAPADEEPAYSLCFFADSVYLAAEGDRSDTYPTPNWNNVGRDDDLTLINIQLRDLVRSWNRLDFLPSPEDTSQEEGNGRRADALFSDLNTLFSLSKDSYSYFTCYSGGGPVTLEIGVVDEAAVDACLAAWTGTKWDELRKVPGRVSQARQEEFAQAAEKLDLGPGISFHVTARNGPSLTETGRIFIAATVTGTEPLEDIPQEIKDLAEEMGIPEDMLSFLCNTASGSTDDAAVSYTVADSPFFHLTFDNVRKIYQYGAAVGEEWTVVDPQVIGKILEKVKTITFYDKPAPDDPWTGSFRYQCFNYLAFYENQEDDTPIFSIGLDPFYVKLGEEKLGPYAADLSDEAVTELLKLFLPA